MWVWTLIIVVSVLQVCYWALDRSPPFRVESYTVAPVHRGEVVSIDAKVWRDVNRGCSVTLANSLYDSKGVRYSIEPPIKFTPGDISALDRKSPGRMMRNIQLPDIVPAGPASIVSSMEYECNLLQEIIRPIRIQAEFEFEILS